MTIFNCAANLIHQQPIELQCQFVKDSCGEHGSNVKYFYELYYCVLQEHMAAFVIISIIFLVLAFYILGSVADEYLSPALSKMSDKLKLSEGLAGVTLLAFSNGAPDVISSFSAGHGHEGVDLVIGSTFGGGLFVTTFVLGFVLFAAEKIQVESYALIRDIGFYIFATGYLLVLGAIGYVTLWSSIGFLLIYPCYVTTVYFLEKRRAPPANAEIAAPLQNADTVARYSLTGARAQRILSRATIEMEPQLLTDIKSKEEARHKSKALGHHGDTRQRLSQEDPLRKRTLCQTLLCILQFPLVALWKLTIPSVEEEDWNKWLAAAQPFTSVYFFMFALGFFDVQVGPVWLIVYFIPVQLALSAIILKYCSPTTPPKYEMLRASLALVLSIMWIYKIAVNVVTYLEFIGFLVRLHPAFLGLSLLAWGNSMGDLFGNRALAKMGCGVMALTGCFAEPLFSLLVGLGLSLFRQTLYGGCIPFQLFDLSRRGSFLTLIIPFVAILNLVVSLVYSKFNGWNFTKRYGSILLIMYAVIMVSATVYAFFMRIDFGTEYPEVTCQDLGF